MLRFLRHIGKKLVNERNFQSYILYALGEIFLVVVGILIALQVNSWSTAQKDREMEKRFLSELMLDLQSDSLALAKFKRESDQQVEGKDVLKSYFRGKYVPGDSLILYFEDQWKTNYSFNPITTTLDEMKSTGNLRVIRNPGLRRGILEIYNYYEDFISIHLAIYQRQQQESSELNFSSIPKLYPVHSASDKYNIKQALENYEIQNRLMGNYANGMNQALQEIMKVNSDMLRQLRIELEQTDIH